MTYYQLYQSYQREYLDLRQKSAEVRQHIANLESQLLTDEGLDKDARQKINEQLGDLRQQETDLKERSLAAARGMVKFSPVEIT